MVDQVKVAAAEEATSKGKTGKRPPRRRGGRLNSRYGEISRTVTFSLLPLAAPSAQGYLWARAKPSVLQARRSSSFI